MIMFIKVIAHFFRALKKPSNYLSSLLYFLNIVYTDRDYYGIRHPLRNV